MSRHLLLVEDQQDVARTLARALSILGYVVTITHNCMQARLHQGNVDCAILDVDLPDGTGLDLALQLRATHTPHIVFFSGCAEHRVIAEANRIGVFVPKLAGVHELIAQIEACIARTDSELVKAPSLR